MLSGNSGRLLHSFFTTEYLSTSAIGLVLHPPRVMRIFYLFQYAIGKLYLAVGITSRSLTFPVELIFLKLFKKRDLREPPAR